MTRKILAVTLCVLVLGAFSLGSAQASERELALDLSLKSYFYNLEYMGLSEYREGETFFGDHLQAVLDYRPGSGVEILAGVFATKTYGADRRLEPVEPIFRLRYVRSEAFGMDFGTLDTSGHQLHEALYDDTLAYTRPVENGMEFYGSRGAIDGRIWVNWQRLNTPAQREKLDVGWMAQWDTELVTLEHQGHIVHYGGQLFAAGQPVSEGVATEFGLIVEPWRLKGGHVALRGIASYYVPDRGDSSLDESGYGGELEISMAAFGWDFITLAWVGDNLFSEDGDPFYMADTLLRIAAERTFRISDHFSLEVGTNLFYIENKTTSDLRIILTYDEGIPLKKK